jgi:hypothetical protein
MVAIRRFIWPEYTTIVLKSLLTMAFSTRRACLEQQKKFFFSNWDFGGLYWEKKDNAIAQKTYTHSTLLI